MPKNVILAASLPAAPDRLFDMYLDAEQHAAFTGAPVTIEPRPGAAFRAFDGAISGNDFARRAEAIDRADLALGELARRQRRLGADPVVLARGQRRAHRTGSRQRLRRRLRGREPRLGEILLDALADVARNARFKIVKRKELNANFVELETCRLNARFFL